MIISKPRPYHGWQWPSPYYKRMKNIQDNINKWIIEAQSDHNDGWTKQYYRDELQKIYDRLNQLEFILKNKNAEKSN